MKTRISVSYECSPQTLMAALVSRQFHEDKIQALGALHCEVLSSEEKPGELRMHIRRVMKNDASVPKALAKLIPSQTTVEHRDEWDAKTRRGKTEVSLSGVPVRIVMTMSVIERGAHATLEHDCVVESRTPLIGGALERFVASQLEQQLPNEKTISAKLLERYA